MDDLVNYSLQLSRSQGISYLRAGIGDYDTMLILRRVAPPSRTSVVTRRVIWVPPDGVV